MAALFGASLGRREATPPADVSVSQAVRPAVELIARLSAERTRLRDDLQRLRGELGKDEAPAADAGLRAELDRVRAERDTLRRERDELRAELGRLRAEREGDPLGGILDRLERVASRLELADQVSSSSRARRRPSERAARPASERARREAAAPAPATGGGGLLGALLKQNMALRPGSDRAARPAPATRPTTGSGAETPASAPRRPAPADAAPQGGGLLGALVAQNLAVRTTRTPPSQGRARAA